MYRYKNPIGKMESNKNLKPELPLYSLFMSYLRLGFGLWSGASLKSIVYFLLKWIKWESHTVFPTHFYSGEWALGSHSL